MPEIVLRGEFVDLLPLMKTHAGLTLGWRMGSRAALLQSGATDVEAQAQWIASRPAAEYNFVIALKNGRPVGMVSLVGINKAHGHAEPARFLIGDEDSVRGVPAAVEAMKLVYALAFDTLGLRRVFGNMASENKLMAKWQRYLGMTEEGRLRRHYVIDGRVQDAVLFGMLEQEYRQIALPRMLALMTLGRSTQARSAVSDAAVPPA